MPGTLYFKMPFEIKVVPTNKGYYISFYLFKFVTVKKIFVFLFLFGGHRSLLAQTDIQKSVLLIIKEQESAWNHNDLRGFMQGYWQNDSLQFVTPRGITYGWENMLHHYLQTYPDKESMGTLAFSELQSRELSPDYFFVTGKWQISRTAGEAGGFFTLLFKNINGQWKIVVDHTD
jgi:ketosteroid isomerase-like protein